MSKGNLYIGCMNMRGTRSYRPDNCIILNCTSMQRKDSIERKELSPMSPVKGTYRGFWNFEHYWQSGKVFDNMTKKDIIEHIEWWKKLEIPKRRCPKYKNVPVLYSMFSDNIKRNYIDSRKEIYLPEYYELVKNTKTIEKYKKLLDQGQNIIIYDFDGPRSEENDPLTYRATKSFIKKKLNDDRTPFGHGYIVALILLDIDYQDIL